MKKNALTILIPVHNEEDNIEKVVRGLLENNQEFYQNIIVIDDGSTDHSFKILKNFPQLKLLHSKDRQGKGSAIRRGLKRVKTEFVLLMDGDGQNLLEDINQFYSALNKQDVDMILGSRIYKTSQFSRKNLINYFGNLGITKLINFLFRSEIKDALSGMRLLKTSKFPSKALKSKGFEIETELLLYALTEKYCIETIQIKYNRRMAGDSKYRSLTDSSKIIKLILGATVIEKTRQIRYWFL